MKRSSRLIIAILLTIWICVTFIAFNTSRSSSEFPVRYHGPSSAFMDKTFIHFSASRYPMPAGAVAFDEILNGPLQQDDFRIIKYIREREFLVKPSEESYALVNPNKDPSMGQAKIVKQILKNKENGFFVECGALDGETRSNTLDLEMNFGWKGLLIEADPKNLELLAKKNRKAWIAKSCLATKPYPHQVFFRQGFNVGKISRDAEVGEGQSAEEDVRVQCFPLFSLLSALNVTVVDYFSLDVVGHDYEVLKTIPFDKLLIKVISVDYMHNKEKESEIERYMMDQGYRVVTKVTNGNNMANDLILAHESVDVPQDIKPINT